MPVTAQRVVDAKVTGWAGQTFDFDFLPAGPGEYTLISGDAKKPDWSQRIIVK